MAREGTRATRVIARQVRGSLIRVRHARYYVDDNGPRINIHAGDAHKCYRCNALLVLAHDATTRVDDTRERTTPMDDP